jgi:hypothetical protein
MVTARSAQTGRSADALLLLYMINRRFFLRLPVRWDEVFDSSLSRKEQTARSNSERQSPSPKVATQRITVGGGTYPLSEFPQWTSNRPNARRLFRALEQTECGCAKGQRNFDEKIWRASSKRKSRCPKMRLRRGKEASRNYRDRWRLP